MSDIEKTEETADAPVEETYYQIVTVQSSLGKRITGNLPVKLNGVSLDVDDSRAPEFQGSAEVDTPRGPAVIKFPVPGTTFAEAFANIDDAAVSAYDQLIARQRRIVRPDAATAKKVLTV